MRADDRIVDSVVIPQLDLDALTQRGEHLSEHDLLVPARASGVALNGSAPLE